MNKALFALTAFLVILIPIVTASPLISQGAAINTITGGNANCVDDGSYSNCILDFCYVPRAPLNSQYVMDLGAVYDVDGMTETANNNYNPDFLNISISQDGSAWTHVIDYTVNKDGRNYNETPFKARFIKITQSTANCDNNGGLSGAIITREVLVYGTPAAGSIGAVPEFGALGAMIAVLGVVTIVLTRKH